MPQLSNCSLMLHGSDGSDQLMTECPPDASDTITIYTNIIPYQLTGMWMGYYMGPSSMELPPIPAYIPKYGYEVGVAVAEMIASTYRAAGEWRRD